MGELVLVMEKKEWDSSPGELLRKTLEGPQRGLSQDEPVFNIVYVPPKDFSRIFQTHRNVIIVDFNGKPEEVKTEIKRNSWAMGQVVMKISAAGQASFADFMEKYSETMVRLFNNEETNRQIEKNKIHGSSFRKKLSGSFPETISVVLQKDSYVARNDSNFLWFRFERGRNLGGYEHQISQGILIYWQHYSDTIMLSPERIISDNDSVAKIHVSGAVPGSYMTTSFKLFPPEARKIKYNNMFAVEIRGLWRMEKDFMGGPFISLTFIDEKSNMIITANGYVFAPQFDKLLYMREVEAMVKSITIER